MNASTGREYTDYFAVVPSQHFPLALDVLTDMLSGSLFDQAEIERERQVITEELNSIYNSPPDLVNQLIEETLWGNQALGRDIAGTRETVAAIAAATIDRLSARALCPRRHCGQRRRTGGP